MATPRIQVLPNEVVEQIAAGEVVERPASVVKELVENSLDAGARRMRIETEAGGKELIRIADDGCGMTSEEAELALLRHATSKLRTAGDLFNIRTLGFRGEALPSIAAVSEMEILTRREDVPDGARIRIAAGRVIEREAAAAPVGTTITVRRLFFNVPARQKFLKSDGAETAEITRLVQRLALSHPATAFELAHDGKEALRSPGGDDPLNAVVAVLGRAVARDLVRLGPLGSAGLRVSGFCSLPTLSRGTREHQLFFVNGRPVRSPLVYRAIDDAYRSRLPSGRHAVVLLFLEIDPADVDVNVHPSKIEVRFHAEPEIHGLIHRALEAALTAAGSTQHAVPSWIAPAAPSPLDPTSWQPEAPSPGAPVPEGFGEPAAGAAGVREQAPGFSVSPPLLPPGELPFAQTALGRGGVPPWERHPGGEPRYRMPEAGQPDAGEGGEAAVPAHQSPTLDLPPEPVLPELNLLGQAHDLFILAEAEGRLWIIDQHVAHERVLFDQLVAAGRQASSGGVGERTSGSTEELQVPSESSSPPLVHSSTPEREPAEALLVPLVLPVDARQALAVAEHADMLAGLGFSIETFGHGQVRVGSVPRSLVGRGYEQALRDMIDELAELSQGGQVRLRKEQLALAAAGRACKAAVKAGMALNRAEMERILADLRRCRNPYTCPHGRPVFLTYAAADLTQLFGLRTCE
jgi:DNA mismatch repair protein MutL